MQVFSLNHPGVCAEPGGIHGFRRMMYKGPYHPGGIVIYDCNQTLTCQRDGTWIRTPICTGNIFAQTLENRNTWDWNMSQVTWTEIYFIVVVCGVTFLFADADEIPQENYINGYNKLNRWFNKNMCNLQVVPSNIPAEAVRVYLQENVISLLPPGVFSKLSECQLLHLQRNEISSVEKVSFIGLRQLHQLYLDGNPISHISEGSFDNLYSIRMIGLKNTPLQTLHPNLFVNLPRYPLQLGLSGPGNKWLCKSLCWLKLEEIHNTVVWENLEIPICLDGGNWSSLQCGDPGESCKGGRACSLLQCGEPGKWNTDTVNSRFLQCESDKYGRYRVEFNVVNQAACNVLQHNLSWVSCSWSMGFSSVASLTFFCTTYATIVVARPESR